MDIVILPKCQGTPTSPGLFSSEGLRRLMNLLGWLADRKTTFDLYIVVPNESGDLLEPLVKIAQVIKTVVPGTTHLLFDAESVTESVLAPISRSGLRSLIVSVGPSSGAGNAAQQAIAGHVARRPPSPLKISVWLQPSAGFRNLSLVRAFQRSGVPADRITPPALPLRHISELGPPASASVPGELLCDSMMCDLYANTLTIDADGNVRACTRYEQGGVVGNLMRHSPEALIIRKGQMLGQITSGSVCLTCGLRGRFLWPERKSVEVTRLFHTGMAMGNEERFEDLNGSAI